MCLDVVVVRLGNELSTVSGRPRRRAGRRERAAGTSVSRPPASTSSGASIRGARASESKGCLRSSETGRNGYCLRARLRRLSKGETSMTARTGRLAASLYRDPAAETAAEDDDAFRVDVTARPETIVDGEGVGDERRLARTPLAQPVAAVVDGRGGPGREPRGVEHLTGHLFRVAAEIEDEPPAKRPSPRPPRSRRRAAASRAAACRPRPPPRARRYLAAPGARAGRCPPAAGE